MDFDLSGMQYVAKTTTITIQSDANAPFISQPAVADFKWEDGSTTGISGSRGTCTATSCTFTFTDLPVDKGKLVFTKQAKVVDSPGPGTVIMAAANASASPDGIATIANDLANTHALDGVCQGSYLFTQELKDGGAWLVDMKFGDKNNNGKVFLTPGDRTIVGWTAGTTATDWVKFIPPAGSPLTAAQYTAQIMAEATYRANDPSAPIYAGGAAPNAAWFDSLNWPYDPSTFTGSTRLLEGTTIQVQRAVTYSDCFGGVYSSSPDPTREFGIATQIAINDTPARGSDFDIFSTPGTRPPASCESKLYVSTRSNNGTSSEIWQFDPNGATSAQKNVRLLAAKSGTDAIAASADYPSLIFAHGLTGSAGLRVWDVGANPKTYAEPLPISDGPSSTTSVFSAAFDKEGNLWIADSRGGLYYLTKTDVGHLLDGAKDVAWKKGAQLNSQGAAAAVLDFAFDSSGQLYVVHRTGQATGYNHISTVPGTVNLKSAVTVEMTYRRQLPQSSGAPGGFGRSLAFVGDKLYFGIGLSSTVNGADRTAIYEIDRNTFGYTNVTSSLGYTISAGSDFASCSFGDPVASAGPAFKVQKSVINQDGTIAAPGTAGSVYTMNTDGSMTIDYLVTVVNYGNASGELPAFNDTLTVPSGFKITGVKLDGTPLAVPTTTTTTFSFNIGPTPLKSTVGENFKTYKVSLTVQATDLETVDWAEATTCGAMSGSYGGGFFNKVTTSLTDSKTDDYACVPTEVAQLKLKKQIVNQNGAVLSSTDSRFFQLHAYGPTNVSGISTSSDAVAADKYVIPGKYSLVELAATGQEAGYASYRPYSGWACYDTKNGNAAVPFGADGLITVTKNMYVECVVKNTRIPKVHVVKTATDHIAGNDHYGVTVTPDADGAFLANYTVTVTNTTGVPYTTGAITDRFIVPGGLVWDGTKTAAVTYEGTGTAQATGVPTTLTQDQLAKGATLATSIVSLPSGVPVTFKISIPLKLDLAADGTWSAAPETQASLGVCDAQSYTPEYGYVTPLKGIPNVVSLLGEDQSYSDIWLQDNVACIPVKYEPSKFKIVKTATSPTANPHVGTTVVLNDDGSFLARYTIKLTNLDTKTGTSGPISDTFVVPAGLVWDGEKTAAVGLVGQLPNGATWVSPLHAAPTQAELAAGVVLTGGIKDVPGGASVTMTIDIPLKVDLTPSGTSTVFQQNYANLGVCSSNSSSSGGPYTDATKGIPNTVTLVGEDTTYSEIWEEDNVACVPVPNWRVLKRSWNGTVNAAGQPQFVPYGDMGKAGPLVSVNPDGTLTVYYMISVVNTTTGVPPAPHPAIHDTMTLPEGFVVTGASWWPGVNRANGTVVLDVTDPTTVTTAGDPPRQSVSFTIPAATANSATVTDYFVQLDVIAPNLAAVNWTQAGVCENTDDGDPLAGGFFNFVSMIVDSDGTHNNDACTPVTPPKNTIKLVKVNDKGQRLEGAQFTLFGPDDQTVTHSTVTIPASGEIVFADLANGTYWLKETTAPQGYAVDPTTYQFTVSAGATITGIAPANGSLSQALDGDMPINGELHFENLHELEFPMTGGLGSLPYAALGLALMAMGAFALRSARRRA
ncbi:MAG: prealbumin-like fold domain-containing protein [Propionibacteriaceae bacterium]|nr:prealbumin-like fold domain-containing protein [Propionibacteriaceae bacterium]